MKIDYEIVIIGAGVIGLAIAKSLVDTKNKSVLIIEKDETFGRGISSRNSEVIHSGIYYPKGSLKQRLCLEGRRLLYDFCNENNIWHDKCGKLVVAQKNEISHLENLFYQALANGIRGVKEIDHKTIKIINENISAYKGLLIKSTGIVSVHDYMASLYNISSTYDHDYLFKSSLIDVHQRDRGYELIIDNPYNEKEIVNCELVINCAGLKSDLVSKMILGNNLTCPEIKYSKGCYFKLSSKWKNQFNHLIYPIPDYLNQTLGIHLTIDRDRLAKLGPSAEWLEIKEEDYTVSPDLIKEFYEKARIYIPELSEEDLSPDYAGIRPKIHSRENKFNDFYINDEKKNGFPGWINLIGIESPGITSSLAIGKMVAKMVN